MYLKTNKHNIICLKYKKKLLWITSNISKRGFLNIVSCECAHIFSKRN